jgi:signal transduction histidine kinase
MHADRARIRQALLNVFSNAVKFTANGEVTINVNSKSVLDNVDLTEWVCFDIHDTGIGMSEQQIQYIFKPFTQGDDSMTRQFGGTGIGLNLTHHLWTMMGGSIDVQSQLKQGSTFRLSIPVVYRTAKVA